MPKIKNSPRFSYDWVTEATRADYASLLYADAKAFTQWRFRRTPPAECTEATFRGWWNSVGPTAFATPDDGFRYRRELWRVIEKIQTISGSVMAVDETTPIAMIEVGGSSDEG